MSIAIRKTDFRIEINTNIMSMLETNSREWNIKLEIDIETESQLFCNENQ